MKLKRANQKAFTLIEMILAIGIAAIVLVSVNGALFTALRLRDDTSDMADAAAPVDATVQFIKRDLECCVTPTNGTTKVLSGAFRAGHGISSSSSGAPVAIEMYTATGALSSSAPWADIQRVTYELKTPADARANGQDLYRSVSRNLLSVSAPQVDDQLMLSGVSDIQFSCYDGTQWQPAWDTTGVTSVSTNLPQAVKVDIRLAGANSANLDPIEIVVPLDCVVRTNMVLSNLNAD